MPLANFSNHNNFEQPLDLSKKDAYAISLVKDSDGGSSRHTASPCGPKEEPIRPVSQPRNDVEDVDDSPLVIDEETTDSGEPKKVVEAVIKEKSLPKVKKYTFHSKIS